MKTLKKKENVLNTRRKTGVFVERVNGIVVGYFVGWRYWWSDGRARNIRAGLYFSTPAAAVEFRDSLEDNRTSMIAEQEQIA